MKDIKLLKNKNFAPENFGKVCVFGLGKTGMVVADYFVRLLEDRVDSLHVYAGEKTEFAMKTADKLIKRGATVSFDDNSVNEKYDLAVMSPGIKATSDIYKSAEENCEEVISEVELAWRESSTSAKWIAITGTNGKTTTTSLVTHILKNTNLHAVSVGNIGNVALAEVEKDEKKSIYMKTDVYVAEMSSYQLHACKKFSPYAAALLNITPDHISWHGTFEAYKEAKMKIFNNAKYAVINVEDPQAKSCVKEVEKQESILEIICNKTDKESIVVERKAGKKYIVPVSKMQIFGELNYINARAAASLCDVLGVPDKNIADGLMSFKALEHRIEPCGIVAGVRLFNDSKATNVDATIQAIKIFDSGKGIFMLGGHDKGTELDELIKQSYDKLKAVVVYGESKDRFKEAFDTYAEKEKHDNLTVKEAKDMRSAFKVALELAFPGDYVVLSPACSSFDEFKNFEERGEVFKNLVQACK